ncbi:MAG: 1-deoxy-D-xylulose-5-phosphate synthase [Spirochaetota bacterium]|nr:1-deoxy-D-xylulose-5-phosphate synthase [Spirochaetota bacterium]
MEYKYLEKIDSPNDLKKLSPDQLPDLCKEIRNYIESVVFETGGHLSSNLGVVELTVALHYIFDFLNDKLIFDVSHQCYTHKILTGRRKYFHTLRQQNGISGFTNKSESPYDVFSVGHAGTSISTALGIAIAKRLKNEKGKAIAFIGDASIGAGMAFEALNHAGHTGEDLIVILNDNNMSISETIGSFSKHLTKIRLMPIYREMKRDFLHVVNKIPALGGKLKNTIEHLTEAIKCHLTGKNIFEDLNIDYYGPIDGHDLPRLIQTFSTVKERKGPVLLHVITEKGRGHYEAVNNPEKYHGVSPSNKKKNTNSIEIPSISFTDAFSESLIELAYNDDKIVGITAAMPGGTGLDKFQEIFPNRYFDVGICEQHSLGLAAGLSTSGLKPVCAIYSTFIQRAYDQIFQEACLSNNHMILVMDRAGIVGEDGSTHAGVFDIAFLRTLPNIVLMSPKDSNELKEMLRFSMKLNCPVGIRYPRERCVDPFNDNEFQPIEMGKGEILKYGNDVILLGYGVMAKSCIAAAEILKEQGINAMVVNARFVKPIDRDLIIDLLSQRKPIITVEDHSVLGGFGSAVIEIASQIDKPNSQIYVLGIPDQFVEHGNRNEILKKLWLDPEGIASFTKLHVLQEEKISI